jgi:hypothetical protein
MTNFEAFKTLFQIFKVENYLKKHWLNTIGWTTTENMHMFFMQ